MVLRTSHSNINPSLHLKKSYCQSPPPHHNQQHNTFACCTLTEAWDFSVPIVPACLSGKCGKTTFLIKLAVLGLLGVPHKDIYIDFTLYIVVKIPIVCLCHLKLIKILIWLHYILLVQKGLTDSHLHIQHTYLVGSNKYIYQNNFTQLNEF